MRNTGPMSRPTEVDALFEPFRQLGTERIRTGEGYGLGLAIVRAIATAHGATLTAHANPAGGLTIQVTFPAQPANGQSPETGKHCERGGEGVRRPPGIERQGGPGGLPPGKYCEPMARASGGPRA